MALCALWLVPPGGWSLSSCVQTLPQSPPDPRGVPCREVQEGRICGWGIWMDQCTGLLPEVYELFSSLYRKPAHHKEPDLASPLPAHEAGEPGRSSGPELGY